MISINNIVNVEFTIKRSAEIAGSYNTALFLVPEAAVTNTGAALCSSIDDVKAIAKKSSGNFTDEGTKLVSDAAIYFGNGGVKLLVQPASAFALSDFKNDIESAKSFLEANNKKEGFTDAFIYAVIDKALIDTESSTSSTAYTLAVLQSIVDYIEGLKAPYIIRLCLTTTDKNFNVNADKKFDLTNKSVIVKYANTTATKTAVNNEVLATAAYFTQVDLNTVASIKDYCYTPETIFVSDNTGKITELVDGGANNVSNEDYEILKNRYNFIDSVGNKVVNFGGNLTNTTPASIDFANICAENDIVNGVLDIITNKQYLTDSGLTNVVSEINRKLQRYKTNGYLNVGAQYSGEDFKLTYNGRIYDVLNHGATLSQGFYIFTIPVSNISVKDKNDKKFPPIYVIMETQGGARLVEINGEVRI